MKLDNIEWLFFDVGATLVSEEKPFLHRLHEIADIVNEPFDAIQNKVTQLYKEKKKGEQVLIQEYGIERPRWRSEDEELFPESYECLFVYVNTMIISYLDRKTEFTTLAKIGMTSRQVYAMIFGEGATYGIVISLIIAVCVGMVEVMGKITLIGESWKYRILVSPLLFCVVGIIVVSALVPIVVFSVIRAGDK